jgi:hypothetical protein
VRAARLGLLLMVAATACRTANAPVVSHPPVVTRQPTPGPLQDAPRRPGKPLVFLAMPDNETTRTVRTALIVEIKRDFDVRTLVVDQRTTDIGPDLERSRPACVMLIEDAAVRLYAKHLEKRRRGTPTPPVVVIMSSYFDTIAGQLANATGVSNEIPAVTYLVNLRSLITRPVNKVGVVHRPTFRTFIERQRVLAEGEQITIIPVEVSDQPSAEELRGALHKLGQAGVDSLWIMNDNDLLTEDRLRVFRAEAEALHLPVAVGRPSLVSTEAHLGTMAVLPDLGPLGVQAANLLFDISENDWSTDANPVELPISTVTVVNMRQVKAGFALQPGATDRIDKVIE